MYRLTTDFHINKRIIDDISQIQTKRLRNKIAGFTTHLMKRIEVGPVRGISLRLQEEVSSTQISIALIKIGAKPLEIRCDTLLMICFLYRSL